MSVAMLRPQAPRERGAFRVPDSRAPSVAVRRQATMLESNCQCSEAALAAYGMSALCEECAKEWAAWLEHERFAGWPPRKAKAA